MKKLKLQFKILSSYDQTWFANKKWFKGQTIPVWFVIKIFNTELQHEYNFNKTINQKYLI